MGAAIAKIAFMPPPQEHSAKYLATKCQGSVQFLKSSEGDQIAFMHFTPNKQSSAFAFSTSSGGNSRASLSENSKYTLLYCHGNAEDLAHSHNAYQDLATKMGCAVYAFDYPGYSASSGTPSESGAIAAGEVVLAHLLNTVGISRDRLIIVGRSLGSGIATELASRHRGLGGLILISPLKSCAAVAGKFAYYTLYGFDLFPNIRRITNVVDYPILVFAGDRDQVVPYDHSVELAKEAGKVNKQTTFVRLQDAGHNDIEIVRGRDFFNAFREFISSSAEKRDLLLQGKKGQDDEDGSGAGCFSSSSSSSVKK